MMSDEPRIGVAPGAVTDTADLAPNLALPWVSRLRYGMVAGEAVIILGMAFGFRLNLPLPWTLAPLLVVLASNIALGQTASSARPISAADDGGKFLPG